MNTQPRKFYSAIDVSSASANYTQAACQHHEWSETNYTDTTGKNITYLQCRKCGRLPIPIPPTKADIPDDWKENISDIDFDASQLEDVLDGCDGIMISMIRNKLSKLEKQFETQLAEKDKEIERLKEENDFLKLQIKSLKESLNNTVPF